jgi:hypothetical protein
MFFRNNIFYPLQNVPPNRCYMFPKNVSKYFGLIFKNDPIFLILFKFDIN